MVLKEEIYAGKHVWVQDRVAPDQYRYSLIPDKIGNTCSFFYRLSHSRAIFLVSISLAWGISVIKVRRACLCQCFRMFWLQNNIKCSLHWPISSLKVEQMNWEDWQEDASKIGDDSMPVRLIQKKRRTEMALCYWYLYLNILQGQKISIFVTHSYKY